MSQKLTPDSSQKGFAVGRGLLAAAETLNFSMGESRSHTYGSNQQLGGMMGLGESDEQDTDSQRPTHRSSNQVGNTLKLFASLGLSPSDLDVLAQIPEENITVETLPHLLKQLKNRKTDNSSHVSSDLLSRSFPSEPSFRGSRNEWESMQGGRMERSSANTSQTRSSQGDYGYSPSQDVSSRGYESRNYGSSSRNPLFSELSSDPYRSQGMSSSFGSDSLFMQRRVGAPSNGKIQDFLGVMPLMFPHVCALCDFDVHSSMEWTQHTSGMRHAEKCRVLLQLYPDWDPHMISGQRSDSSKRSDDLFGPSSFSDLRSRTGMGSNYGSDSDFAFDNKSMFSATQKIRSRVVVVKYNQKPKLNVLFNLANQFGSIRESLVLKNKAFLELQTHEDALAMANFYQNKPAMLNGNRVKIYLSRELRVIEKNENTDSSEPSCVVFFSNLPRETKKKSELLTIARRFGTVVNHLFLSDQAFVQLSNPKDAEMLVKYYTVHPLSIARQSVQLNICTKYKTLKVVPGKGEQIKEEGDVDEEMSKKSSSSTSKTTSKTPSVAHKSKRSISRESSSERAPRTKNKEEAKEVVAKAGSSAKEDSVEGHIVKEEKIKTVKESTTEQPNQETSIESESTVKAESEDDDQDANGEEKAEEKVTKQESPLDELAEVEDDQNQDVTNELDETDKQDDHDKSTADSLAEQEDLENFDLPENMEEFVTLDELEEEEGGEHLDSESKERFSSGGLRDGGGLRVVNVVGFKRSYGFLNEILALAKPFGKVVAHFVLHSRAEAFLELEKEEEARSMVRFYSGNVKPSVCGRVVKIYHSLTYATIQSGKVVYVGHIPPGKSAKRSVLKLTEPYGKIRRYYFNRARNECFIEMEQRAAERFVKAAKLNPYRIDNQRVLVYISKKYKQLKHGIRPPSPEDKRPAKREHTDDDEPPTKKAKEDKPSAESVSTVAKDELMEKEEMEEEELKGKEAEDQSPEEKLENTEEPSQESTEENMETQQKPERDDLVAVSAETEKSQEMNEQLAEIVKKPETSLENLGSYDPVVPVGVEFLKMGYYCKLCFLFYSNEDTAKRVHCSSQGHFEKLKKHLEKQ